MHIAYLLILWLTVGIKHEATAPVILMSLLLSVLIGVGEELVFRGLIYQYLLKYGVFKAIIFSAILFGVAHIASAITNINSLPATLIQITNAFFFGWATASLVAFTKSLWIAIIWHFLVDFFTLIFNFSFLTIGGWIFMISMVVFNVIFSLYLHSTIKESGTASKKAGLNEYLAFK